MLYHHERFKFQTLEHPWHANGYFHRSNSPTLRDVDCRMGPPLRLI
jgi:hypothetical protein